MSATYSVHSSCERLFGQYPLAIRNARSGGHVQSIVLMLEDESVARFYVLSRSQGERDPFYSLFPWPAGRISNIEEEVRAGRPLGEVSRILDRGVPIPLHGSFFGWRQGDSITAMIATYANYSPPHIEPSWTVMPLADAPEMGWPPFTRRRLFGSWFWNFYHEGSIISLSHLIASSPGTVFWVDTMTTLGSGTCVVAADLSSPEGYSLPGGRYVHYEALRARKLVPSLKALLSSENRVDLAPRFRQSCQL